MAVQTRDDESGDDPDYEVGYGKPPKSGQFKTGHKRSKGRRKGSRNVRKIFEDELFAEQVILINGRRRKVSAMKLIFRTMKMAAMKGDPKMIAAAVATAMKLCPPPEEAEETPALNDAELALLRDHVAMRAFLEGEDSDE